VRRGKGWEKGSGRKRFVWVDVGSFEIVERGYDC
tara:strand:- start:216 stop:317 length:102 start_codon:yes stop_codon:yes gene_type:complete